MNICRRNSGWLSAPLAFLLFASQLQAVVGEPQLPNPGKPRMTRQEQVQLGYQTAAQVYKQMPVLPDNSAETQYIRQLGEKLAATIPQQYSWPFQFHVIPQKEINAFALPGGPMFVNIGTITAASNEAELVGVMAHEMAHVYMQHSAKQASSGANTLAGLAGLAGAILGATGGWWGQLASAGIQFGAQGIVMKYSRDDESQADAVGAIIMYRAGYNPQAMADFFQKLAQEGSGGPQFLSDHPNPGNREAAIEKEIASWPSKRYMTNSAAFTRAKQSASQVQSYSAQQIAQGSKSGQWASLNQKNGAVFRPPAGVAVSQPASAQGATPTNGSIQAVFPSTRMVREDLGPIRIARPENWDVMAPSERGRDVMIAPRAGMTENGIGYGVALNGIPPQGQNMSLDEITAALVRQWEQTRDMQAQGSLRAITVNGVQGRSVALQSTSPFLDESGQPQREQDWLVTLPQRDGSVLYMVFVAPQAQFAQFRPAFEEMLKSVQF